MANNQNKPRKFDVVLGGETPPPLYGAVLGGVEGVKQRLSSSDIETSVAALTEALNYGEIGLDLVIKALENKCRQVQKAATSILKDREDNQAQTALRNFKFWTEFEKLNGPPKAYAKKFTNRKIIEFDGQTNITETVNIAYALRTDSRYSSISIIKECQENTWDKFNKLLQNNCATKIEALVFSLWTDDGTFASTINALVTASEKLTNLKAIFIGDTKNTEWISPIAPSNLSRILEAYPNLEALKVRGSNRYQEYVWLKFTPALRHENLKALIVESGGLSHQSINHICKLELPALEYLELWLGNDYYGGDSSVSDLMPIISGVFPKLKYLGLRNSRFSNNIAFAIANSSIIENLVELDLSIGDLNDNGVKPFLDCPAINSLDTLNISNNYVSNWMIEKLEQLDIEVISGKIN